MKEAQPPVLARKFLTWFCSDELSEEIEGDLLEAFYFRKEKKGLLIARLLYVLDVIRFFKPYSFEKYSRSNQYLPMFKNYLKIAFRNIIKRKGYTAINLGGLVVSLSVVLLIGLFLFYHLTYDSFYPSSDRTYRLINNFRSQTYAPFPFDGYWSATGETQLRMVDVMEEMEEIEQVTIMLPSVSAPSPRGTYYLEFNDKEIAVEDLLFTNTPASFLEMFPQEWLLGSFKEFVSNPSRVVITDELARKNYGDEWKREDIVGTMMDVDTVQYVIAGVVKHPRPNSHFQFNALLHVNRIDGWGAYTYFELSDGVTPEVIEPKINAELDKVMPGYSTDPLQKGISLQPLTEIHTSSRPILYELRSRVSKETLWIFGAVGLTILLITWTNYMNLSIAIYSFRQKEMGIRKVLGARSKDIGIQLMIEVVLIALLAFPVAWTIVYFSLDAFNSLMEISISRTWLYAPGVLLATILTAIVTGIISGSYPAMVFSHKKLTSLFRARIGSSSGGGKFNLRRILLGFQFLMLVTLISTSIYLFQQMSFIHNRDLGFNQDGVLTIPTSGASAHREVSSRLLQLPAVQYVGSGSLPGANQYNQTTYSLEGFDDIFDDANIVRMDLGVVRALGLDHPAFERLEQGFDSVQLINRTLADKLKTNYQLDDNELIDRKIISEPRYVNEETGQVGFPYGINGIIDDFHYFSLRTEINPLIFEVRKQREYAFNTVIKINTSDLAETMGAIEDIYQDVESDLPFSYTFLDDRIETLYKAEQRSLWLITMLSGTAIFLAIMGLIGLVSYMVYTRQKEIGVRKVFGASLLEILLLINREFILLIAFATIVSGPLVYWIVGSWLDTFAYRIVLNPVFIAIAGLLALLLIVLVVSGQSFRTAKTSPAVSLKDE